MPSAAPTYGLSREVFLRLLALVYLSAFVSLWVQLDGLVGSGGILPARAFLANAREQLGGADWHVLPTLCWLDASDGFLRGLCGGGCAAALLLLAGVAPVACLLVLWVAYLSLSVAGQVFLHYQWDTLLLEAGLLALVCAPGRLRPRWFATTAPDPVAFWLLRWLLFRLMLLSVLVKFRSGDPTWADFTALQYHYWTQPIPTWTSWWAHQLPAWVHAATQAATCGIELLGPFLIFCGRGGRRLAVLLFVLLQLGIAATGNYGFFNLLTCVLCVPLLDDQLLQRLTPARWRPRYSCEPERWPRLRSLLQAPLVCALFVLATCESLTRVVPGLWLPSTLAGTLEWIAPLRSVNSYGLFAVMTTTRPEIQIEGSDDGAAWQPYEFRWKPGAVDRAPAFCAPHMPRLDWQMWFAALGPIDQARWSFHLFQSLLEARPAVLALLAHDPFGGKAPRYVRATLWQYRFTSLGEGRTEGAWWTRTPAGTWCPPLYLEQGRLRRAPL